MLRAVGPDKYDNQFYPLSRLVSAAVLGRSVPLFLGRKAVQVAPFATASPPPPFFRRATGRARGDGGVRAGGDQGSAGPASCSSGKGTPPPHPPRTKWTRRVPHPVLIGHATPRPSPRTNRTRRAPLAGGRRYGQGAGERGRARAAPRASVLAGAAADGAGGARVHWATRRRDASAGRAERRGGDAVCVGDEQIW